MIWTTEWQDFCVGLMQPFHRPPADHLAARGRHLTPQPSRHALMRPCSRGQTLAPVGCILIHSIEGDKSSEGRGTPLPCNPSPETSNYSR